jgi:HPt (histidine-containing phosphotransfer) domain-containing protein
MTSKENRDTAASGNGGRPRAEGGPIDLAHLARQTMDDATLEAEILRLFREQALSVGRGIAEAGADERRNLAHGLKGAARAVGAFRLADLAARIEEAPGDAVAIRALADETEAVVAYLGSASR